VRCNVAKIIASLSATAHGMGYMKLFVLSLAGFVTLFGMMATPVRSWVLPTDISQTQAQPEAKTYTGTILKSGGNFVLSESGTESMYLLDNHDMARPYEGKKVKITGTIDGASNLIHIETIQEIV
jgi:hypothetical protein